LTIGLNLWRLAVAEEWATLQSHLDRYTKTETHKIEFQFGLCEAAEAIFGDGPSGPRSPAHDAHNQAVADDSFVAGAEPTEPLTMTVAQIAVELGITEDAAQGRCRRARETNLNCFVETNNRRANQSRYLYYRFAIMPLVQSD
jgi:hypothetical protein